MPKTFQIAVFQLTTDPSKSKIWTAAHRVCLDASNVQHWSEACAERRIV